MTESELMAENSATMGYRTKWALEGNAKAIVKKIAENMNPNLTINPNNMDVFHRRMAGLSDDGARVIGPDSLDLPK